MSERLILRGGRVVDPAAGIGRRRATSSIEDGWVADVGRCRQAATPR